MLPNPVGYNRVYVNLGDQKLTRNAWFSGLASGRCFVTNGPLLRVKADSQLSGTTFELDDESPRTITFSIQLTSNDRVPAVEVVHNGRVVSTIACADQTDQQLTATVQFDQPGWVLVRAIADVDNTFRFASTAPWYIESGVAGNRISRSRASCLHRLDQPNAGMTASQKTVLSGSIALFPPKRSSF